MSGTKCINKDCKNHTGEGTFYGPICSVCYHELKSGEMSLQKAIRTLAEHGVDCKVYPFRQLIPGTKFEWLRRRDNGPGECIKLTFAGTSYWCYTDFRTGHLYTDSNGESLCVIK